MSNEVEKYKQQLPTLADIYADVEMTTRNTALSVLLNAEPQKHWIKKHPFVNVDKEVNGVKTKVPLEYIPVERVEYLLTRIFGRWKLEVKESGIVANSIQVIVRLHYIDPVTGEWEWQDGIGASPLQTNSGAGATDFNQIKSAAVQMAAPAAESYAMKDAAEKLGKIFGKDLNRKDEINYQDLNENNSKRFKEIERTTIMIKEAETPEQLANLKPYVTEETTDLFNQKQNTLTNGK